MFNRNMDVINLILKSVVFPNNSDYAYDFTNSIGVPIVLPDGSYKYMCNFTTTNFSFFTRFLRTYESFVTAANNSYNISSTNSDYGSIMIHFGSNNTAPSKEDFNLKSPYINGTNYKQLSAEYSINIDKNNDKVIKTLKSYNQAITNLTINELGLTTGYCYDSLPANSCRILLSRDVLDTPLEVTAGKGFSLSISWEESLGLSKLGEITSVSGS